MNAPERIRTNQCGNMIVTNLKPFDSDTEYTRSDIHAAVVAERDALRAALVKCAAEIAVPHSGRGSGKTHCQTMYDRWRSLACARADIARAALSQPMPPK